MKVKIYLHSSIKAKIDDDIVKFNQYFLEHGIKLSIDIEKTDVPKQDAVVKLMLPNDGKYAVVFYLYNKDNFPAPYFGLCMNISLTLQGIYLATSLVDDNADYTWKSMCHELMHALFCQLANKNIMLFDPMDKMLVDGIWKFYYKNEELDAPDGNFARAWQKLKSYIYLFEEKPTVILERISGDSKQTLGELRVGSLRLKTLELGWHDNLKNISCIPKGEYHCRYTFSPKFMKYTYEVMSVPNRTGIRIHSANYHYQIQGCIALGTRLADINNDTKLDVVNSKVAIKELETLLNKREFILKII